MSVQRFGGGPVSFVRGPGETKLSTRDTAVKTEGTGVTRAPSQKDGWTDVQVSQQRTTAAKLLGGTDVSWNPPGGVRQQGGTPAVQQAGQVTQQQAIADVTASTVSHIESLRGQGVGAMSQAALDHTVNELLNLPPSAGFRNADGSPNWTKVADYSMAICGSIFVGPGELRKNVSMLPASEQQQQMLSILGEIPEVDLSQVAPGESAEAWRANLDTSNPRASLRSDFDDGSPGQARHTWMYIVAGYAMPSITENGASMPSFALLANGGHELVEGNWSGAVTSLFTGHYTSAQDSVTDYDEAYTQNNRGSRQDFSAGVAGFAFGSVLRGIRDAYAGTGYNSSLALTMGVASAGFFAGPGDASQAQLNSPVTLTPSRFVFPQYDAQGNVTGTVDVTPLQPQSNALATEVSEMTRHAILLSADQSFGMYELLGWADTGRSSILP